MSKICINCGNEQKDSAKFCGKCGYKFEEVIPDPVVPSEDKKSICPNCKSELRKDAQYCDHCGNKIEEEILEFKCKNCGHELRPGALFCDQCGCQFGTSRQVGAFVTEEAERGRIPMAQNSMKTKGKNFLHSMKNCKIWSNKKTRNIVLALSGIVVVIVIALIVLIPSMSGVSDEVVGQAALQLAEQDKGYQLELVSYDVIDSFTAQSTNLMSGNEVKAKMYLVIIEAEMKDQNGSVVETVKYGASIVDPQKSGEYVSCSPMSQIEVFTGMENKEIEEQLRSATARYH